MNPSAPFSCCLVMLALGACDNAPTKLDQIVDAAAHPPPPASTVPAPPPPPAPPAITVDDTACTINGEEVLFMTADARGRIAAVLGGKPLVEGQVIAFDAARDAKTPKVATVIQALKKVKAKGAVVRTPMRDASVGQLPVVLSHGDFAGCTAVGMVNRDGTIAAWSAGGGTAQKFARGFAGPDLTLGSEGLRKLSGACDSPLWVISGDDNIPWGLTFDLALAARGAADGGAGMRASGVIVPADAPVPGRPVKDP